MTDLVYNNVGLQVPDADGNLTCPDCGWKGLQAPCPPCYELRNMRQYNASMQQASGMRDAAEWYERHERLAAIGRRIGLGVVVLAAVLLVLAAVLSEVVNVMGTV